jgi:hypothetical protein
MNWLLTFENLDSNFCLDGNPGVPPESSGYLADFTLNGNGAYDSCHGLLPAKCSFLLLC